MTPEILRRISISLYLPLVHRKKRIFPVKPASGLDKVLNVGELHLLGEIAPARFVMALGGRKLRADAWRENPRLDDISSVIVTLLCMCDDLFDLWPELMYCDYFQSYHWVWSTRNSDVQHSSENFREATPRALDDSCVRAQENIFFVIILDFQPCVVVELFL